jgi:hypothetical protein
MALCEIRSYTVIGIQGYEIVYSGWTRVEEKELNRVRMMT